MPSTNGTQSESAPRAVRRLRGVGETCLWLLLIGALLVAALGIAWRLKLVVLPVLLSLILATFLRPPAHWLVEHGWPRGLAATVMLASAVLVLGGLGVVVVPAVVDEVGSLNVSLTGGLSQVEDWLAGGPLTDHEAQTLVGHVRDAVSSNLDAVAASAVSGALMTLEIVGGLALSVVLLFFFLKDGDAMWDWLVGLAPPQHRDGVDEMGRRSWHALGGFVRGQTLTALFDAVFIGLALLVLGVPLVLPLAVITFFGGYVPILGATIAGAAAALVALVANGLPNAIGVVIAVLIVQQLEGNIFQPVIVGRAISVHPVAILLGVTAGGILGGIVGAMIAAPTVAVLAAILTVLRERSERDRAAQDLARHQAAPGQTRSQRHAPPAEPNAGR